MIYRLAAVNRAAARNGEAIKDQSKKTTPRATTPFGNAKKNPGSLLDTICIDSLQSKYGEGDLRNEGTRVEGTSLFRPAPV